MQGLYSDAYMAVGTRSHTQQLLLYVTKYSAQLSMHTAAVARLLQECDDAIAAVIRTRLLSPLRSHDGPIAAGTAFDEHAMSAVACLELLNSAFQIANKDIIPCLYQLMQDVVEHAVARLRTRARSASVADNVASALEVRLHSHIVANVCQYELFCRPLKLCTRCHKLFDLL